MSNRLTKDHNISLKRTLRRDQAANSVSRLRGFNANVSKKPLEECVGLRFENMHHGSSRVMTTAITWGQGKPWPETMIAQI